MFNRLLRIRRLRALVTFFLIAGVLAAAPAAAGGPPADLPDEAADRHRRVVEFWTNERVAQAQPRDFIRHADGSFGPAAKPDNPGKGNGNGGGGGGGDDGGTTGLIEVKGASWSNGGDVAETSGKVLFSLGTSYYICSASAVTDGDPADDAALVLTAAHCVYDTSSNTEAANWMFVPNYDAAPASLDTNGLFCDDTVYGCWVAETLTIHDGYIAAGGFDEQAIDYDFAVASMLPGGKSGAELDTFLKTETGSTLPSLAATGALAIDTQVFAFGYPAEKKFKGDDLIYCAGGSAHDPRVPADTTYRLEPCDLNGGSSGGPWYGPAFDHATGNGGALVSVNSYGYADVKGIHGPVFDGDTTAVYDEADGTVDYTYVHTFPNG